MGSFVLAGGGSGGHVNPLLATAAELQRRGHQVVAVGTKEGLETELVPRAGVELRFVDRVPLPRRPNAASVTFPRDFSRATTQAAGIISDTRADAVVGFGGYVSTPVYRAARKAGVPVVVHEANARPGFANKYGARFAAAVATTFPGTTLPNAVLTGLPLRPQIAELAAAMSDPAQRQQRVADAREARGWPADAKVLLVTGGSLGAASLNSAVSQAAATLVRHGIHVIHLTGHGKDDAALRAKGDLPAALRDAYQVSEYAHDMGAALAAASAVVCRAGANTVSEVSALCIPAMYVPLPIGNGEQALNARSAVAAGAAVLVDDAELTPARVELEAERLILDAASAAAMAEAAARVGIPDGAARLADLIEGVAS
ncbi:undecaprenyldiphospho-muramoylpentapeptide beta-N-acetylglucosaminyltransferase [Demequina sp.]|uniref:undecaprenyldiphospho-muramoylpentapeptide beta-N-acetylglucosaminyltransferase n=1 Tax=Demequina sp. TaxID=2050685 RepID=UPI003D1384DF